MLPPSAFSVLEGSASTLAFVESISLSMAVVTIADGRCLFLVDPECFGMMLLVLLVVFFAVAARSLAIDACVLASVTASAWDSGGLVNLCAAALLLLVVLEFLQRLLPLFNP